MNNVAVRIKLTAFLLCSIVSLASDRISSEQAAKLIDAAVSKGNIFDLPSFRLRADIRVLVQNKPMEGKYELLWNGPSQVIFSLCY